MSERPISSSGELEEVMAGIYEEDADPDVVPGDVYTDSDGEEWIVTDEGELVQFS